MASNIPATSTCSFRSYSDLFFARAVASSSPSSSSWFVWWSQVPCPFSVLPRTRHLLRPDSVALAKMFEKTERVRVLGHIRPPAMTFGRICPCASFKPSSGHLRWGLSNPFEMVSPESPPLNFSRGPLGRVSSRL